MKLLANKNCKKVRYAIIPDAYKPYLKMIEGEDLIVKPNY